MKKNNILLIISAVFIVAFSGCKKEDVTLTDPLNYNRPLNLAAPIFNAHFSASDLLERIGSSEYIQVGSDGLLKAQFDTTFSVTYDDVVQFSNMEYLASYDITALKKSAKAAHTFTEVIPATVDPEHRYDSLYMASAFMELEVTVPSGFTGNYKITFPEIIKSDGDTLNFTGDLANGSTNESIDILGSKLSFFQTVDDKSAFNMITTIDANPEGIPSGNIVSVSMKLLNYKPGIIWGYFGKKIVNNLEGTINPDLLSNFNFGDAIQFKSSEIKLLTLSEFGVPLSQFVDSVVFSNTESGDKVSLEKKEMHVDPATYINPDVELATDSIVSDISDGINIAPNEIYYKITTWTNYFGDVEQNFIVNDGDKELFNSFTIDIPFWFKATSYLRTDTIGFDVRNIFDSVSIDYLDIMDMSFEIENGFPFNIYAQAYVVDSLFNLIDSLFIGDQLFWKSPVIDSEGLAGAPAATTVGVLLNQEQLVKFYDAHASQILIKSSVLSGGLSGSPDTPEFVKLFERYAIDLRMSLLIKSGEIKY